MYYRTSVWVLLSVFSCSLRAQDQTIPTTDFMRSLLKTAQYTNAGFRPDITSDVLLDWQDFGALYDTYIVTGRAYAVEPRIPKIIHHIWLGSPLPERCKQFIDTWKKHHPDWVFVLWDDARVARLQLVNQLHYDAATNYGEKSDIARYEILYRFGGLYLDTDFECLQPFDALHHCCDFYVGACVNAGGGDCHVFNGLFASKAGHPVLKRCIEGIGQQSLQRPNIPDAIINRTGPGHLTRCLKTALAVGDEVGRCVAFPPTYFYAWPGVVRFNKDPNFIRSFVCPESLAIHHWASSWLS